MAGLKEPTQAIETCSESLSHLAFHSLLLDPKELEPGDHLELTNSTYFHIDLYVSMGCTGGHPDIKMSSQAGLQRRLLWPRAMMVTDVL